MEKEIKAPSFLTRDNIISYVGRNVYLGITPFCLESTTSENPSDDTEFFITINDEKFTVTKDSVAIAIISPKINTVVTTEPDPYIEWIIDLAKSKNILHNSDRVTYLIAEVENLSAKNESLQAEIEDMSAKLLNTKEETSITNNSTSTQTNDTSLVSTLVANDMEKYRLMMNLLSNGISKKV